VEIGRTQHLETAFENAYATESIAWAQLGPGSFDVRYGVLDLPMLNVSRRDISVSATFAADVAPDRALVGLIADGTTSSRFFGIGVDDTNVAASRTSVELTTTGPSAFYTLVVDELLLQREFPNAPDASMLLESFNEAKLARDPWSAARLRELLDSVFLANSTIDGSKMRPPDRKLVGTLIPLMSRAIHSLDSNAIAPSRNLTRRIAAVRSCVAFMHEHSDSTITLLDLSQLTGLESRTLLNAFEAVVGVSPMAYLRRLRLNGVRRDLQRGDLNRTIAAVATDWGFWHLGHFTAAYQAMFGELPSRTLSARRK
jgi:AraC family transcriptional regulator, ethanolamine operon transcriptional activator